jgi:hypothetical protein
MISPETLIALKPFGVIGLLIVAVVTIVSLVSLVKGAKPSTGALIALVIAAGLGTILAIAFGFQTKVFWTNFAFQGDWGGQDEDCGAGSVPDKAKCDDDRVGRIAVCWDRRAEGWPPGAAGDNCRGSATWCTYKNGNVHFGVVPNGQAPPGRVYICARGLVH